MNSAMGQIPCSTERISSSSYSSFVVFVFLLQMNDDNDDDDDMSLNSRSSRQCVNSTCGPAKVSSSVTL